MALLTLASTPAPTDAKRLQHGNVVHMGDNSSVAELRAGKNVDAATEKYDCGGVIDPEVQPTVPFPKTLLSEVSDPIFAKHEDNWDIWIVKNTAGYWQKLALFLRTEYDVGKG